MTSAAQFRPGPPPALTSEAWARDYNEVKALGGKASTRRSAEQTEIARFWEYSLPSIYYGVVRSVAQTPGRDVAQQRAPVRRGGAGDGRRDDRRLRRQVPLQLLAPGHRDPQRRHRRQRRDRSAKPAWAPFIDAPMHPEYPSAHSILAGAVGTVLKAEIGNGPMPVLTTTSPTAKGATRRWTSVDDFMREVATRASTTASTTARRPRSASRWASRSASWR